MWISETRLQKLQTCYRATKKQNAPGISINEISASVSGTRQPNQVSEHEIPKVVMEQVKDKGGTVIPGAALVDGWVATTGFFDHELSNALSRHWYVPTVNQLRKNVFINYGYVLKTVYHFDLNISDEDKKRIQDIHDKKFPGMNVVFGESFPKNAADCPPGMELERMHILIDAAHLVEYAIREHAELHSPNIPEWRRSYLQEESSYHGYDVEFLARVNYMYVGFDNFKRWMPTFVGNLRIKDGKMQKKKFYTKEWIDATQVDELVK